MKINRNVVLASLILILSVFIWWQSSLIPTSSSDLTIVDAAFMPKVIAILLTVLVVFILWKERGQAATVPLVPTAALRKVILFIVLMTLAALGFRIVGFEPVAIVLLAVFMYLLGLRHPVLLVCLPLAVTAVIHIVFIKLMYVPLPSIMGMLP